MPRDWWSGSVPGGMSPASGCASRLALLVVLELRGPRHAAAVRRPLLALHVLLALVLACRGGVGALRSLRHVGHALAERRARRAGHVLLALVLAELAVGLGLRRQARARARRVRGRAAVVVPTSIAAGVGRLRRERDSRRHTERQHCSPDCDAVELHFDASQFENVLNRSERRQRKNVGQIEANRRAETRN